eukprot:1154328-Pelagomonas_calceolata.AAC.3
MELQLYSCPVSAYLPASTPWPRAQIDAIVELRQVLKGNTDTVRLSCVSHTVLALASACARVDPTCWLVPLHEHLRS